MEKLTDEIALELVNEHGVHPRVRDYLEDRIKELESALEKAQQCLIRCGDEWEGLSDSTLPDKIQVFHRKIAAQIGETLQQLEQALKGKE